MKRLTVLLLICFLLTGDKMGLSLNPANWMITDTLQGQQGGFTNPLAGASQSVSQLGGLGGSNVGSVSNLSQPNQTPQVLGESTTSPIDGSMRYNSDGTISRFTGGQWVTEWGTQAGQNNPGAASSTGGTTTPTNTSADEQAYYDQQLADIDRLLGRTNTAEAQGLQSLQDSAAEQKRLIEEQRQRALNTYDNQKLETDQSKERGFGQVNDFANNSYRSLMRLFQGGNAGGGSVAKQLMPSLVSKSAGTRRQGVIDQAGQNYRAIDSARADAESQFGYNSQDIENQRKNQERDFLLGIGNQRNSLDTQKGQLQVQRAQASGQGYAQARSAADASRNSVDARQAQLDALFGTYKPQYTARATNLQTPTLGKYTIDPAQINGNQNLSVDSRYYGSQLGQLKKKQQEQGF